MHRLIVLVSFLFSNCVLSADIHITNQYAKTGEAVAIFCVIPRSESYQMFRLIRGDMNVFSVMSLPSQCPKSAQTPPAIKLSFKDGYSQHFISNYSVAIHLTAQELDSGEYKCVFMDGNVDYVSAPKTLTVGELAYVKSLYVRPKVVIQGNPFNVECIGSKGVPEGTMKLYSRNKIVDALETQVTAEDGTPLTKLQATLQAPQGSTEETFICRSVNILNKKRTKLVQKNEFKVIVPIYHPPNSLEILPVKKMYTNGDTLICSAKGYPAITFKWIITYGNNKQNVRELVGKSLKFSHLHSGKIVATCIAENTIGRRNYTDRLVMDLDKRKDGIENLSFEKYTASTTKDKASSPASSNKSAKKSAKTTTQIADQLISTPSLKSQTTQLGVFPMAPSSESKSGAKSRNVSEIVVPKRHLTKTDRRYENVLLYLKLSISFNLIFGIAILFTMIGLCLRMSNFMK